MKPQALPSRLQAVPQPETVPGHSAHAFRCLECGSHAHVTRDCPCLGSCCTPWFGTQREGGDTTASLPKGIWWRLAISLLLAGQGMLVGLAVNLSPPPAELKLLLQSLVGVSSLVVFLLLAKPLLRGVFVGIWYRRLGIEAMFLVTMSGAAITSLQSLISGQGPIYFEVISILLCVYTVNRLVGFRSRSTARHAAERWSHRLHWVRRIDSHGQAERVPVDQIVQHDLIEVHPGEWIPIDGVIETGLAFVRDTPLTGEPFARTRRPGDLVLAGFAVEDATLTIRASVPGNSRQINTLLAAVGTSQESPLELQRHAERLMAFFLPIVLTVAAGTFLFWTAQHGWESGLFHAMSVLLIACPCALGLATPIAVWSALGNLAERGLILRRADVIERLAEVDCILFDKTGTLTHEQLRVVDVVTASHVPRERFLGWLAEIESRLQHPIANSLARLRRGTSERLTDIVVSAVPGQGIDAMFRDDSGTPHHLRAGQSAWLQDEHATAYQALRAHASTNAGQEILVEWNDQPACLVVLKEHVRESVAETMTACQQLHLPVFVLSGDEPIRVQALGIRNATGSLKPLEKQDRIATLQQDGARCLYVGDGMNDAPALTSAHASIALSSGMDLAMAAAPATLFHGDLRVITWSILQCRQAVRLIRSNIRFAAAYNTLGMGLAACGFLEPVTAAVLMVLASLTVGWRSASVLRFPQDLSTALRFSNAGKSTSAPVSDARPLPLVWQMILHGCGWGVQGLLFSILSGLDPIFWCPVTCFFVVMSFPVIDRWRRHPDMSHEKDMAFGMLTVGNLGMLAGAALDRLRHPEMSDICDARWLLENSSEPFSMPIGSVFGMLLAAWFARRWLTHRPCPGPAWRTRFTTISEQFTMTAGMFAASAAVASLELTSQFARVSASCLAMACGMVTAMWLTRAGILAAETVWIWLSGGPEMDGNALPAFTKAEATLPR